MIPLDFIAIDDIFSHMVSFWHNIQKNVVVGSSSGVDQGFSQQRLTAPGIVAEAGSSAYSVRTGPARGKSRRLNRFAVIQLAKGIPHLALESAEFRRYCHDGPTIIGEV